MAGKAHPLGFCNCSSMADHWDRPRHWSAAEVDYLEQHFGRMADARIAAKLGRPEQGIRIKAKRLRLRKRDIGLSAQAVGQIFGVDAKLVTYWIARGLLQAKRGYRVGPNVTWCVTEEAIDVFIVGHAEWVDIERMPDSCYRVLAQQQPRWYSLPEVERLVGQSAHMMLKGIAAGLYRAVKRGPHWYVPESELPAIARNTDPWRRQHCAIIQRERQHRLRRRKNKRNGIGAARSTAVARQAV